jgi:hypothetical protein
MSHRSIDHYLPEMAVGAPAGYCISAGCRRVGAVRLGRYDFCRGHWPGARRWWSGDLPWPDLHEVYDRTAALGYVNARLRQAGTREVSEGAFLKATHEVYERAFRLEPLRLGERPGGLGPDETRARVVVFTKRMLDEYVAGRLVWLDEVVRPSAAERATFLASADAVAWVNERWEARGIDYRVDDRLLAYHVRAGRLPVTLAGRVAVYRRDDLAALVEDVVAAGGWDERPKKANWKRTRRPRRARA